MQLDNYANRVRFVRALTKLSREAFEKRYGISRNTLKSWELGINTLTEKSAKQISDAIEQEGFSCTPEWLIFGIGHGPHSDGSLQNSISEQTKMVFEAEYFKKNNSNSITSMITDASMLPNFQVGDYIGGILDKNINKAEGIKKFIGSICIIYLATEIVLVRKIIMSKDNMILVCPLNTEFEADMINVFEIQAIASIIWHRSTITGHSK